MKKICEKIYILLLLLLIYLYFIKNEICTLFNEKCNRMFIEKHQSKKEADADVL